MTVLRTKFIALNQWLSAALTAQAQSGLTVSYGTIAIKFCVKVCRPIKSGST